jgi:hypothetical protein
MSTICVPHSMCVRSLSSLSSYLFGRQLAQTSTLSPHTPTTSPLLFGSVDGSLTVYGGSLTVYVPTLRHRPGSPQHTWHTNTSPSRFVHSTRGTLTRHRPGSLVNAGLGLSPPATVAPAPVIVVVVWDLLQVTAGVVGAFCSWHRR